MGLVALPAAVAIEQSAWKPLNTMITARGAPIRAVGVDVAISYEGKFVPGEVILWGSVGSKILNANLLLDGLHELFPKQDLYDFFGVLGINFRSGLNDNLFSGRINNIHPGNFAFNFRFSIRRIMFNFSEWRFNKTVIINAGVAGQMAH